MARAHGSDLQKLDMFSFNCESPFSIRECAADKDSVEGNDTVLNVQCSDNKSFEIINHLVCFMIE